MGSYELDGAAERRMGSYIDGIGDILRHKPKRASFGVYFLGLLGEGERKSIEPMAARAAACPDETRALTERLLGFIGESKWDDAPVRAYAAKYASAAMTEREAVTAWIIDDTGFLKQGNKSPGVQRQYTGSAGKTTNCQVAVSLSCCTETLELPVDMALYLPESWTKDRERCRSARIPAEVEYQPKWKIALEMLARAVRNGLPGAPVLADAGYGNTAAFRKGVSDLGLDYGVDVQSTTRVRIVGFDDSETEPMTVEEVAEVIGDGEFKKIAWREGTRETLESRFAFVRVRVAPSNGPEGDEEWLVIDRPHADKPPVHYTLSTLSKRLEPEDLIRQLRQRWRIERTYEDMKGELGLDHFEGRSFPGWQHHVTCVLSVAAFVVAERARAFPPSARRSQAGDAVERAA